MIISETKLDESFPIGQFKVAKYTTPFRVDRDRSVVGITAFKEQVPVRCLSAEDKPIEAFFSKVNLHLKRNGLWVIPTIRVEIT